jgi:hypothetical protein
MRMLGETQPCPVPVLCLVVRKDKISLSLEGKGKDFKTITPPPL